MAGKQAKLLTASQVRKTLNRAARGRYPARDRVIVLLSHKAGLRAGEIAKLTWPMVLDPDGRVGDTIQLHDIAAKKRSGRVIPMHPLLRAAIVRLRESSGEGGIHIIRSERGTHAMRASSVVN